MIAKPLTLLQKLEDVFEHFTLNHMHPTPQGEAKEHIKNIFMSGAAYGLSVVRDNADRSVVQAVANQQELVDQLIVWLEERKQQR